MGYLVPPPPPYSGYTPDGRQWFLSPDLTVAEEQWVEQGGTMTFSEFLEWGSKSSALFRTGP